MDCLAAAARHSVFLSPKGKLPLLDHSFRSTPSSSPASRLRPQQHHRSYGAPSFTQPLHFPCFVPYPHVYANCNCSKFPEGQVRSLSSHNADLNRENPEQNGRAPSASPTNRKPNKFDTPTISLLTRSNSNDYNGAPRLTSGSINEHVRPIANPGGNSYKENGNSSDAKLTNDKKDGNDGACFSRSRADHATSEAVKTFKNNDWTGGALPSTSSSACEDEEFLSSAPLVELTNDKKDGNDGACISRSCGDHTTSKTFKPSSKKNDWNGGASPSTSSSGFEDDEFLSSGPLVEMHSRVSGNSGFTANDNADSSLSLLLASKNVIEFISRFPGWADAQKESGMPQRQRRAFYSHEDWLQHRSSLRYVRHILSSVSSRVIVSLVPPVFTFTAGALGVTAYNTALKFGVFPSFFPLLHAASLPYELTAPALALLLVFRTDASYSRYDEARKTWTSVISTTKDLARQSTQLIKNSQDLAIKSSFLSYIMAFPVSLKCHLIHGSDTRKDLQDLLQDDDLAFVLASLHRPNCLIQLMSQSINLLRLENTERLLLENHITQYTASVSVCERLIRTPIPLSYTRLTSRFLVLWHSSLPIILWDSCNWLVVPATFFSAATLFCIEEVGVLIEEPFPMLALDRIIGVAHDNIREMMKRQQETDNFLSGKRNADAAKKSHRLM